MPSTLCQPLIYLKTHIIGNQSELESISRPLLHVMWVLVPSLPAWSWNDHFFWPLDQQTAPRICSVCVFFCACVSCEHTILQGPKRSKTALYIWRTVCALATSSLCSGLVCLGLITQLCPDTQTHRHIDRDEGKWERHKNSSVFSDLWYWETLMLYCRKEVDTVLQV